MAPTQKPEEPNYFRRISQASLKAAYVLHSSLPLAAISWNGTSA